METPVVINNDHSASSDFKEIQDLTETFECNVPGIYYHQSNGEWRLTYRNPYCRNKRLQKTFSIRKYGFFPALRKALAFKDKIDLETKAQISNQPPIRSYTRRKISEKKKLFPLELLLHTPQSGKSQHKSYKSQKKVYETLEINSSPSVTSSQQSNYSIHEEIQSNSINSPNLNQSLLDLNMNCHNLYEYSSTHSELLNKDYNNLNHSEFSHSIIQPNSLYPCNNLTYLNPFNNLTYLNPFNNYHSYDNHLPVAQPITNINLNYLSNLNVNTTSIPDHYATNTTKSQHIEDLKFNTLQNIRNFSTGYNDLNGHTNYIPFEPHSNIHFYESNHYFTTFISDEMVYPINSDYFAL